MKNYLIILSLFLISFAYGYKTTYVETYPNYGYCPCYKVPYANQIIYHPPYLNYYPLKTYSTTTVNRYKKLPHSQTRMKRSDKRRLNTLSFLNNKNGSLTGYSLPINKDDMYKQMGISPYDPRKKQKYNSINCNQELFSNPTGDETYYNNGYYRDLRGNSAKTGVTIIYD